MDAQYIGQLFPAHFNTRTLHAIALGTSHASEQVFEQHPTGRGVLAVVDGFLRNGALGSSEHMTLILAAICEGY